MPVYLEKTEKVQMQVKVLIVDSHWPFAKNTIALLSSESRILPFGIARDGNECLDYISHSAPDIVLLDIWLSDCSGLDLIEKIKSLHPEGKIIMMLGLNQEGYVIESINKGVKGLLLKDCSIQEMIQAILKINEGDVYFSPSPLTFPKIQIDINDLHFPVKPVEIIKKILTPEEKEIMGFLSKGLSDKEIAAALGLTLRVVNHRVKIILLKFGVYTRLEAVLSWAYVDA